MSDELKFFSITRLQIIVLYVVRRTFWAKKLDVKITYIFLCICYFAFVCLFGVKIIGLSSLESLLPF